MKLALSIAVFIAFAISLVIIGTQVSVSANASSLDFSPNTFAGGTTTVDMVVTDLSDAPDTVQVNVQHSSNYTVTDPQCGSVYPTGFVSAAVATTGGTVFVCSDPGGPVSTDGVVASFTLTGSTAETISLLDTGPFRTTFFEAGTEVLIDNLGTLVIGSGVPPDLLGHWTLDDGAPGQIGTSHDFDGIDDFIDLGNIFAGPEFTGAAWFNSDNLANCGAEDCRIFSKADGVNEQDHTIMVSTIRPGQLRFRLKTFGNTDTLIAGNVSSGTWYHVAATYDGINMRLFLDGVEVGIRPKTGIMNEDLTVPMWIGGNPPSATSRPWDGRIDDVWMFNRALDASEIQTLMTGGALPPTPTPEPPTPTPIIPPTPTDVVPTPTLVPPPSNGPGGMVTGTDFNVGLTPAKDGIVRDFAFYSGGNVGTWSLLGPSAVLLSCTVLIGESTCSSTGTAFVGAAEHLTIQGPSQSGDFPYGFIWEELQQ